MKALQFATVHLATNNWHLSDERLPGAHASMPCQMPTDARTQSAYGHAGRAAQLTIVMLIPSDPDCACNHQVANKVAELLMEKEGREVCCQSEEDKERFLRGEAEFADLQ